MRKSASEIIRNLESRIAKLEGRTAGTNLTSICNTFRLKSMLKDATLLSSTEYESVHYYSEDPEDVGSTYGDVQVYSFISFSLNYNIKHTNYVVVSTEGGPRGAEFDVHGFFSNLGDAKRFAMELVREFNKPTRD